MGVLTLAAKGVVHAEEVPLDADGFTVFMADRMRQDMPAVRITIVGQLTLDVTPPQDEGMTVYLDRVHDYCQRNPADCVTALESFSTKIRDSFLAIKAPIDRGMLRVVVRLKPYVAAMQAHEHGDEIVVEPLTDDLVVVCYIDMPTAMRTAIAKDFQALGLRPEEAMAQAKANLAADIADFEADFEDVPPNDEIGVLKGDVYMSSWMALPEAWAKPAARVGGRLLVAVPTSDSLLYVRDSGPDAVEALRRAAEETAERNEKPISTSVYRWTPEGWKRR